MVTFEAKQVAKYITLGSESLTSLPMRAALVSAGPEVEQQLSLLKEKFSRLPLRKLLVSEIEEIEDCDKQYERLDDAIHTCTSIEEDFARVSTSVSETSIKALVRDGDVNKLGQSLLQSSTPSLAN